MSYPEPVYQGDGGELSAFVRPADSTPDVLYPNGVRLHHLARGDSTHGLFGLYRYDFGPTQSGPDPHFHRTISESFFILSGVVQVHDGTGWKQARSGDYFYVPEGGIHGFRNIEGDAASMLLLFAPGAPREEYFETLAHLAEHPMTPEERADFMNRHDTYWV